LLVLLLYSICNYFIRHFVGLNNLILWSLMTILNWILIYPTWQFFIIWFLLLSLCSRRLFRLFNQIWILKFRCFFFNQIWILKFRFFNQIWILKFIHFYWRSLFCYIRSMCLLLLLLLYNCCIILFFITIFYFLNFFYEFLLCLFI